MPRKQPLFRRLTTATRWPVGVTLTSWHYMWRTTPLYRSEEEGTWEDDAPPKLPDAVSDADVQRARDGAGPLYHRRYLAVIRASRVSPIELIDRLTADPGHSPAEAPVGAHQPHRLGEPRGFPLEHLAGALGGLVAGREAGATGGDDESGEAVAQLDQLRRHGRV